MQRTLGGFKIYALGVVILLGMGGLVARLWYVQIARGEEYTAKIQNSSQVTVRIPAVRGEILDRNGMPLVENRQSFEVDFYLPDIVTAYRGQFKKVPTTDYRAVTARGMQEEKTEADICKIVNETIIPTLEKLDVARDYNTRRLQMHYRNNTVVPYSYAQDLDFETMAKFSENNIDLPGVDVTIKPVRHYVYGAMAAHLLGYVGLEKEADKEEAKKYNFYQPDVEGKAQLELSLNDVLKGTPGARILQRNVRGVIIGEAGMIEPKKGSDVYLTIDARIQYIAEQALRAVGRGAAVVVDPNNGDILAMATVPSFDPNQFIPSISAQDWANLYKDETDPLLNRAISAYAPGSTYKVAIALAGLRTGVGNRTFNCGGGVQYGDKFMQCWISAQKGGGSSHGVLNLPGAIKVSCNGFFYQYGNAAGIDSIVATGNMLGLGTKSGVPLSGEAPGILPGPAWLAEKNPAARWTSGLTANTAIGQGDVLATPLQMAMVVATVANGGTSYEPRLIEKIVGQDGVVIKEEPIKIRSDLIKEGGLTAEQIEVVRKGMWRVVNEGGGTAARARVKDVEVAGKTGTAQFSRSGVKDNHTWFLCFAPYDKPRYAICILVQGAKSGGGVSAPVAGKILSDIFAMDAGTLPQLAAMEPAKGNFRFVDSVDYGREIPAATTEGADEEVAPNVDNAAESQQNRPDSAPEIHDAADEGGRVKNKKKDKKGLDKFFNFKFNLFGGKKKGETADPNQKRR